MSEATTEHQQVENTTTKTETQNTNAASSTTTDAAAASSSTNNNKKKEGGDNKTTEPKGPKTNATVMKICFIKLCAFSDWLFKSFETRRRRWSVEYPQVQTPWKSTSIAGPIPSTSATAAATTDETSTSATQQQKSSSLTKKSESPFAHRCTLESALLALGALDESTSNQYVLEELEYYLLIQTLLHNDPLAESISVADAAALFNSKKHRPVVSEKGFERLFENGVDEDGIQRLEALLDTQKSMANRLMFVEDKDEVFAREQIIKESQHEAGELLSSLRRMSEVAELRSQLSKATTRKIEQAQVLASLGALHLESVKKDVAKAAQDSKEASKLAGAVETAIAVARNTAEALTEECGGNSRAFEEEKIRVLHDFQEGCRETLDQASSRWEMLDLRIERLERLMTSVGRSALVCSMSHLPLSEHQKLLPDPEKIAATLKLKQKTREISSPIHKQERSSGATTSPYLKMTYESEIDREEDNSMDWLKLSTAEKFGLMSSCHVLRDNDPEEHLVTNAVAQVLSDHCVFSKNNEQIEEAVLSCTIAFLGLSEQETSKLFLCSSRENLPPALEAMSKTALLSGVSFDNFLESLSIDLPGGASLWRAATQTMTSTANATASIIRGNQNPSSSSAFLGKRKEFPYNTQSSLMESQNQTLNSFFNGDDDNAIDNQNNNTASMYLQNSQQQQQQQNKNRNENASFTAMTHSSSFISSPPQPAANGAVGETNYMLRRGTGVPPEISSLRYGNVETPGFHNRYQPSTATTFRVGVNPMDYSSIAGGNLHNNDNNNMMMDTNMMNQTAVGGAQTVAQAAAATSVSEFVRCLTDVARIYLGTSCAGTSSDYCLKVFCQWKVTPLVPVLPLLTSSLLLRTVPPKDIQEQRQENFSRENHQWGSREFLLSKPKFTDAWNRLIGTSSSSSSNEQNEDQIQENYNYGINSPTSYEKTPQRNLSQSQQQNQQQQNQSAPTIGDVAAFLLAHFPDVISAARGWDSSSRAGFSGSEVFAVRCVLFSMLCVGHWLSPELKIEATNFDFVRQLGDYKNKKKQQQQSQSHSTPSNIENTPGVSPIGKGAVEVELKSVPIQELLDFVSTRPCPWSSIVRAWPEGNSSTSNNNTGDNNSNINNKSDNNSNNNGSEIIEAFYRQAVLDSGLPAEILQSFPSWETMSAVVRRAEHSLANGGSM